MPKNAIQEWSTSESSNSDIGGTDIAENCLAGGINNAIRKLMGQIKTALSGDDASIITGTAGTNGNYAKWNGDGDLVDGDTGSIGAHTIFIPAASFLPTTTNGASYASAELATNDVMTVGYDFDAATDEKIQFMMAMPKSWNEGTLTAQIAWKDATTAGTGDVIWGVQMLSLGDSDAMDAAFGTAQTVTDTFITSGDIHITSVTSAITAAGTPAEGDFLVIQVYRDADAAGDTYTQDARLLGVKLIMTTNAANDA